MKREMMIQDGVLYAPREAGSNSLWSTLRDRLRPPVKVRAHGRHAIAISARPEFGKGTILLPLGGIPVAVYARRSALKRVVSDGVLRGTADSIARVIVDAIEAEGDRNVWRAGAVNLTLALVPALVELHDTGVLRRLDIDAVREAMSLTGYYTLMCHPKLSESTRHRMRLYLYAVPGFLPDKADRQGATCLEQFGYQAMHLRRALDAMEHRLRVLGDLYDVEVCVTDVAGGRVAWTVGLFPNQAMADRCVQTISAAVAGSSRPRFAAWSAAVAGAIVVAAALAGPARVAAIGDAVLEGKPAQVTIGRSSPRAAKP